MTGRRLLFYGELPRTAVHGVSLSNALNLGILSERFGVDIIDEKSAMAEHARVSRFKVLNLVRSVRDVVRWSLKKEFHCFYLTLSLSLPGVVKTLLVTLAFRVCNRSEIVLHIHRGDFFPFYGKRLNKLLTDIVFKLSGKLIVLSDSQREKMSTICNNSVYTLENSLDTELDLGVKRFGAKRVKFLYISNYIEEKGILDLLEAFKGIADSYPEASLECYGAATDGELQERIEQYRSRQISINGSIFGREKYQKIHESDCLILPSWNEGQPIILLEAMSQGTPIIASDVGVIGEEVGEGYRYLVQARDRVGLMKRMAAFIEDPGKEGISRYLKERYYAVFSREKHREKLLAIFDR